MTVDLVPTPTDEQAMLVDASVRFMESEHPMATVRARADGGTYDDEAYRRTAAELGWFGMLARRPTAVGRCRATACSTRRSSRWSGVHVCNPDRSWATARWCMRCRPPEATTRCS